MQAGVLDFVRVVRLQTLPPGEAMRFLVWNTEMQKYECSDCRWKQALNPESSDPAERLEHEFAAHNCEEHQRKAAA